MDSVFSQLPVNDNPHINKVQYGGFETNFSSLFLSEGTEYTCQHEPNSNLRDDVRQNAIFDKDKSLHANLMVIIGTTVKI